jgi:hypothetical protein
MWYNGRHLGTWCQTFGYHSGRDFISVTLCSLLVHVLHGDSRFLWSIGETYQKTLVFVSSIVRISSLKFLDWLNNFELLRHVSYLCRATFQNKNSPTQSTSPPNNSWSIWPLFMKVNFKDRLRFMVTAMVNIKIMSSWYVTVCSLVGGYRCIRGTSYLHL